MAKATRIIFYQLRSIFIVLPGQAASLLAAIACRIHDQPLHRRKESRNDSVLVHHVDGYSGCPRSERETARTRLLFHGLDIKRRKNVVMHVNAACERADRGRNSLREDPTIGKKSACSGHG